MTLLRSNSVNLFVISFITLLHLATATSFKKETVFQYNQFNGSNAPKLTFLKETSRIYLGALQLTPDTMNPNYIQNNYNKSGRIFYNEPFKMWLPNETLASFNSTFLINLYRDENWTPGHGLAFLIAPNISSMPDNSYGQWLGLTNASTDGSRDNQIVAIEFDTNRQPEFDPDNNHVGLNINSVKSKEVVSVNDYKIISSPEKEANYSVWVDYDGTSKLMEVYMVKEGQDKPSKPILSYTIDLKQHLKQDSYFGFAGSTGHPDIQLNCVLKWSLDIDILPRENDRKWIKIGLGVGVPGATLLLAAILYGIAVYKRRRKGSDKEVDHLGRLTWLPGMPRQFKYKELKKATNNFDERLKLGQGGFGIVYKGQLHLKDNTIEVAVKKFSRDSVKSKDDFRAELAIIHRLRHKHLVRLVGMYFYLLSSMMILLFFSSKFYA